MAGDWIPIELATPRKQEVLRLARKSGLSRREVVGLLVEFWCWVNEETVDGHVDADVDALVELFGAPRAFFDELKVVHWLKDDPSDPARLIVPNAEHWLTAGAKSRLRRNRRQSKWRDNATASTQTYTKPSTSAPTKAPRKPSTTEEKRREEVGEAKASLVKKQKRAPNPIWDAVAEEFYRDGKVPKPDQKRVGRVVSGLKSHGAKPEEVAERSERYRQTWPGITLTPEALLKHWTAFARKGTTLAEAQALYDQIETEGG